MLIAKLVDDSRIGADGASLLTHLVCEIFGVDQGSYEGLSPVVLHVLPQHANSVHVDRGSPSSRPRQPRVLTAVSREIREGQSNRRRGDDRVRCYARGLTVGATARSARTICGFGRKAG